MSAYPCVAATCDQPGCTAAITHSHHPTAYCPDHAPDEEDLP